MAESGTAATSSTGTAPRPLIRRASTGLPPLLTPHTEVEEQESINDLDLTKLLIYGSGFYTALNCFTYPLAVVKTRMQAATVQTGSLEAARGLHRLAGVRGFYAGLLPTLCGALPARAGYITALEGAKEPVFVAMTALGVGSTGAAMISNGAGGFAAVLASQTLWTPWDVVTQRLMVAAGGGAPASESSFFGVARNVFATSGWIGFYRGFGVTLLGYLPGGSVWWAAYGGAKEVAAQSAAAPAMPVVATQAAAATWASFWTVGITSPLDVLKTRVQLSTSKSSPALLPMATALIRAEGLSGLYRGFLPRWCQASLFSASVINIYEELKRICRK